MRLAVHGSPILVVATLVGCSNSSSPDPSGAVFLELGSTGSVACPVTGPQSVPPLTGTATAHVSETSPGPTITDGVSGASLNPCYVAGSASAGYQVSAALSVSENNIGVNIPNITPAATATSPATGSVSVTTPSAVQGFDGSSCSFYFAPGTQEKVAPGSIWVDFSCSSVVDDNNDICAVSSGVLNVENCATAVGQ